MNLDFVKAIWIPDHLAIALVKIGQSFTLHFAKKDDYLTWKEALRSKCLISDLHKEYKVSRKIGTGNFAMVRFSNFILLIL